MLSEMSDQQVAARATGRRALANRIGIERRRQVCEQVPQRSQRVEHLPVARRVGSAPDDDVTPVGAVVAGSPEERLSPLQSLADSFPQRQCTLAGEFVALAVDDQQQTVRYLFYRDVIAREEPDQEPVDSAYPDGRGRMAKT